MFDAVQFRGGDNVIKAYQQRQADTWAIFQKNCLITKGSDEEELKAFLSMLAEGGSRAVYTLKIYDDLGTADIKDKTPADGSFSFILTNDTDGDLDNSLSQYSATNKRNKLFERLEAIEARLNGADQDDEDNSLMGKIGQVLSDPDELMKYVRAAKEIFGTGTPQPTYTAAIGNAAPKNEAMNYTQQPQQPTEKDMQRLSDALDTLGKADPKIIDHLEKLAKLATDKPGKFKSLLTMLETFI